MTKVATETLELYRQVEQIWIAPGARHSLQPGEAVAAAKGLYRFAMGSVFRGTVTLTSGVRGTRASLRNVPKAQQLVVNPADGWTDIVHRLSHYFHRRLRPGIRPHSAEHARLELRMARFVAESGWLDGMLVPPPKPSKPKPDRQETRYKATLSGIERWERKAKRAESALKRLRTKSRYYERVLGATGKLPDAAVTLGRNLRRQTSASSEPR